MGEDTGGSPLTIEMLRAAIEKMSEPPKHDIFKCKECNHDRIFTGWEMTKRVDGLNYFICTACALKGVL